MSSGDRRATASMLEKAIWCLQILGASPEGAMRAADVADAAEVPRATTHRLLKSLAALNMATFDEADKRYRLGPATLNLGMAALNHLNIPRVARPHLEQLARRTLETTTLSMLQDNCRVYLDQIPSSQEIKMTVPLGMTFPLYAGASSKAILSKFPDSKLREYLDSVDMAPLTDSTPINAGALLDEIGDVRKLGYAVSRGERQADAASIAAPIMNSSGNVFGSISVSGPVQRFDRYGHGSIGRMVRDCARAISAEIGYHDPEQTH